MVIVRVVIVRVVIVRVVVVVCACNTCSCGSTRQNATLIRDEPVVRTMSSLAATRADGYYHPPPDATRPDPAASSSRAKNAKKKRSPKPWLAAAAAARNAAAADADADPGIVIRFALPRAATCGRCGRHMGAGSRFNALKTRLRRDDGFRFAFKCVECHAALVAETHADELELVFVEPLRGLHADEAKRRERKAWEDGLAAPEARLVRLESAKREQEQLTRAVQARSVVAAVAASSTTTTTTTARGADPDAAAAAVDVQLNRHLRAVMRERKRPRLEGAKRGLGLALLPIETEDVMAARQAMSRRKVR